MTPVFGNTETYTTEGASRVELMKSTHNTKKILNSEQLSINFEEMQKLSKNTDHTCISWLSCRVHF